MTRKSLLVSAILGGIILNRVEAPSICPSYLFSAKTEIVQDNFFNIFLRECESKVEFLERKEEYNFIKGIYDKFDYRISDYQTSDFRKDNDETLLARLILGETEGCSLVERIAVAYTSLNRLKEGYGNTLKDVILSPYKYSCFNKDTDSSKFLKDPLKYNSKEFFVSLMVSKGVLSREYGGPTNGATHYWNSSKVSKPYWADNLIKIGRIGNGYHVFYKDK